MTVVKIVLLMDHSLVKGTPLDQMFLIIPVHFSLIVHSLCQIEKYIHLINRFSHGRSSQSQNSEGKPGEGISTGKLLTR